MPLDSRRDANYAAVIHLPPRNRVMAKRKINGSAGSKEYLGDHSGVGPSEAAKAISEKIGRKVSPICGSNGKSMMGKSKKKGRRGRKPGSKMAHSNNGSNGS